MDALATCQDVTGATPVRRRRKGYWKRSRPQLLVRSELDQRTGAARQFDKLVADVTNDLGGRDQCSAVEIALIEAFAGAAVLAEGLNCRVLLGKTINLGDYCQIASTLARISSRLGLRRRPKPVNEVSLSTYLAGLADKPEDADTGAGTELGEAAE
jgi:hypothetical protein